MQLLTTLSTLASLYPCKCWMLNFWDLCSHVHVEMLKCWNVKMLKMLKNVENVEMLTNLLSLSIRNWLLDISIFPHFDIPTFQHSNIFNISTFQHLNISSFQHFNLEDNKSNPQSQGRGDWYYHVRFSPASNREEVIFTPGSNLPVGLGGVKINARRFPFWHGASYHYSGR